MSHELENKAAGEESILGILRRNFTKPKLLPTDIRLDKQVAIITGSNVGLGLEAARHLLRLGLSHFIMAARSQARGDAAATTLSNEFPHAIIDVWLLDMASYDSVTAFATRCAELPRLDLVILNAGMGSMEFATVPATGHEITLQVNYLSTALLATLLVPVLKRQSPATRVGGRPPVLAVVSSDIVYSTPLELKDARLPLLKQFNIPDEYSPLQRYGISKLALLLYVGKLAETVSPEQVLVNSVNPGMTAGTNFFSAAPFFVRATLRLLQCVGMARTAKVGASTYIDAVLVEGAKSHGSFLSEWQIKPYPSLLYTNDGKKLQDRLWKETIEELQATGAASVLESIKMWISYSDKLQVEQLELNT